MNSLNEFINSGKLVALDVESLLNKHKDKMSKEDRESCEGKLKEAMNDLSAIPKILNDLKGKL